jgi:hypothetical protein
MPTKNFTAKYRYRQDDQIGPQDYYVDLTAPSLKEAKRIAHSWEGRDARMTWLMEVTRTDRRPTP